MIKVILRTNVDRIGKAGEIISVKDGFARNFLLPQGMALLATSDNIAKIEKEKKKIEQQNTAEKDKIIQFAEGLKNFSCTIAAQAQDENLYGSVTSQDIAQALEEEQIKVDKSNILLNDPIKKLGIYEVEIKLHPEVTTKIKVWVVKK